MRYAGPRNGEHMPFANHRTLQEVREDEERRAILRSLGRDKKERLSIGQKVSRRG